MIEDEEESPEVIMMSEEAWWLFCPPSTSEGSHVAPGGSIGLGVRKTLAQIQSDAYSRFIFVSLPTASTREVFVDTQSLAAVCLSFLIMAPSSQGHCEDQMS